MPDIQVNRQLKQLSKNGVFIMNSQIIEQYVEHGRGPHTYNLSIEGDKI